MNTAILQKCIEELNKEVPRLDYLRGMLETLIAVAAPGPTTLIPRGAVPFPTANAGIPSGNLAEIKRMAGEVL